MNSFERDLLSTLEENLQRRLPEGDSLKMQFEVVPLDTVVANFSSPLLVLSDTKLFFVYDEIVEEYGLSVLEMEIHGEQPKFSIWQIILEGSFIYSPEKSDDLRKMKQAEHMLRLSITEQNQVPRDYLLRNGVVVAKAYQTWAFARLMLNHKNRLTDDLTLRDMLKGWFVLFNQKTVITFTMATTMYFLIRWLLIPQLPELFGGIVDVLFAILALLMGVWIVMSVNKNLERYRTTYFAYAQSEISTPDSHEW